MSVTTVLRGFKVLLPVLDAFLLANSIWETETLCAGIPPSYKEDPDSVSTLLRSKVGAGDTKTRVFIPYRMGLDAAECAYVTVRRLRLDHGFRPAKHQVR